MKKRLFTAVLLVTLAAFTSRANDELGITPQTKAAFTLEFKQARDVRWQKVKDYSIVTFSLNDQVLTAYYTRDAALIALQHHLSADHLPVLLYHNLKKNYEDYWVSELYEAASDNGSHYHLKLENGDQTLWLTSVNATDWLVDKREKKEMM